MVKELCDSAVELGMLARGMAKQHETYQDASQELIDNAVSSIVTDERYFTEPDQCVEICINIVRGEETVMTTIADNGPGIRRDVLRDHVFRTGNKAKSDGILNNVGWGLKASVAWFEETFRQSRTEQQSSSFSLVTQTANGSPLAVEGPITGDLPIRAAEESAWKTGVPHDATSLNKADHGTHIHVPCARERFDADVWPSAERLDTKVQSLRERLGVLFRRLLNAHENNRIMLAYQDLETGTEGIFEVIPITPKYRRDISSRSEGTPHQKQTFELNTQTGSFNIEYECGTLDFEAMTDAVAEENPGLLTHGGNFRRRYRPSQATQGVDIYANGRVLMTSVFSELFDLSRNNQYNYFGGTLRITPKHPEEVEVPTDNKKTRIDTNSELWRQLVEIFSTEEYQPVGKRYDNSASDSEVGSTDTESAQRGADREESSLGEPSSDLPGPEGAVSPIDGGKYGLIRADSRFLSDHLSYFDADRLKEDLVDVTVTSPPYADLKNYGYDTDAQVGFGDNYESYLSDLQNIFGQTYDITKPDGSLWIIINTFKKNGEITQLPADVARICQQLGGIPNCPNCSSSDLKVPLIPQATGRQYSCQNCSYTSTGDSDSWLLQDIIVWDKNRALPYSDNRFRNVFEYILCFSKQTDFHFDLDSVRVADPSKFKSWWVDYPERYHPKGMVPENIWSMTTPSQGSFGDGVLDHPAPFPPELVGQIINLTTSTGDVVFDPFAGSGTVLAQADAMDRRPLGFELSPDYCDDYNAVREYIAGRWNEETSTSHANQQEQLTEIIGGLRQVKQVRELLRKLATSQGASEAVQLDIEAAVHIAEGLNQDAIGTGAFIESSIIFVVDSGVTAQRAVALESAAAEHLSKKPLSSYGVNAKPFVMTATELHSAVSEGDLPKIQGQLFIYTNGRHYEFAETTTLESWLCNGSFNPSQQAQPSVQPILSNLGLDVTNPRRGSGETPTRTVHRLNKQSGGSVSYEHQVATQPNISTGD